MKKGLYFTILIVAIVAVSTGCATHPRVDSFYGTSYELSKQSQIHNPQAGVADGPSVGLEGDIASKVMERYEKGFEKAEPKTEIYSMETEGIKVK